MYLCQRLHTTVHPKNDILCVTDTIQDMTNELHMWQCSGFTAAGGPQQFHKATTSASTNVWDLLQVLKCCQSTLFSQNHSYNLAPLLKVHQVPP